MMRRRRGQSKRRGLAATELALMTPVLGVLCLAVIDFARLFVARTTLADCARNGALYQSYKVNTSGTPDAACAWLANYSSYSALAMADATNLKTTTPVVQALVTGTDSAGNSYVQVTVTYSFQPLLSYPGIPNPVPLSKTARMTVTPN